MPTQLAELAGLVRSILHNPGIELETSTRFEELPAWDSMDLISLIVEAECRFDVLFETDEIDRLNTAGDLLRLIAGKRALAQA